MDKITLIGLSGYKQSGKDTVADIIQVLTANKHVELDEFKQYINSSKNLWSDWKRKSFAHKLKQMVALLLNCAVERLEDADYKDKPLGEEWRRWFYTHYKMKFDSNPLGRLSDFYTTEQEARGYLSEVVEAWGNNIQLESELLTPRLLLQYLGTEALRTIIHPNAWVNALFADYKEEFSNNPWYNNKDVYSVSEDDELQNPPMTPKWIITDVRFPNEADRIKAEGGIVIRVRNNKLILNDLHSSETSMDNYKFDGYIDNNGTIDDLIYFIANDLMTTYNLL